MSNRPRSQRTPDQRGKAFIEKAFTTEITAKAAMLVVHRVARSLSDPDPRKQRAALDQLLTFADAHPLTPDMEALL